MTEPLQKPIRDVFISATRLRAQVEALETVRVNPDVDVLGGEYVRKAAVLALIPAPEGERPSVDPDEIVKMPTKTVRGYRPVVRPVQAQPQPTGETPAPAEDVRRCPICGEPEVPHLHSKEYADLVTACRALVTQWREEEQALREACADAPPLARAMIEPSADELKARADALGAVLRTQGQAETDGKRPT